MQYARTTPVPNALFDEWLLKLKSAELKVLMVIIRQTLGWKEKNCSDRKVADWISGSQLRLKTGSSARAISSAIEALVKKELIEVRDDQNHILTNPDERKGKTRLFYRITVVLSPVGDNEGKTSAFRFYTADRYAKNTEDLRKNVHALAQKLRITKVTLQN